MTPDELRARCEKFVQQKFIDNDNPLTPHGHVIELESLCREMMAVGLESACAYYSNQIHHDMDDYPDKFVKWCRQEAQRVKEGE